ncbi:hypothetical protein RhiJN_24644 [Ceratobasidium sp. AG-Ba]|nr:hypothetical protein RhiJN_24644 [Ceratobasidium sp. AG-Ba]
MIESAVPMEVEEAGLSSTTLELASNKPSGLTSQEDTVEGPHSSHEPESRDETDGQSTVSAEINPILPTSTLDLPTPRLEPRTAAIEPPASVFEPSLPTPEAPIPAGQEPLRVAPSIPRREPSMVLCFAAATCRQLYPADLRSYPRALDALGVPTLTGGATYSGPHMIYAVSPERQVDPKSVDLVIPYYAEMPLDVQVAAGALL